MRSPTTDRDLVAQFVDDDPQLALDIARRITDPWYRCQALATFAAHLPSSSRERDEVLIDAFLAANLLGEPNRLVTVSSWPVKALALFGDHTWMASETERLLGIIAEEPSPVRRADALKFLLGATIPSGHPVVRRVAKEFANACRQPLNTGKRNKKGDYLLAETLPVIARVDQALADDLLEHLPPSRAERARSAIETSREKELCHLAPWPNLHYPQPNSA